MGKLVCGNPENLVWFDDPFDGAKCRTVSGTLMFESIENYKKVRDFIEGNYKKGLKLISMPNRPYTYQWLFERMEQ